MFSFALMSSSYSTVFWLSLQYIIDFKKKTELNNQLVFVINQNIYQMYLYNNYKCIYNYNTYLLE